MAILTVGPTSTFPTIAAAIAASGTGDIISLEAGYSNETATVTSDGLSFDGGPSSTGIVLQLATGISSVTLLGTAPIDISDAPDANAIVGNDGDNIVTVTAGVDVATAGNGTDRLIIDYRLATAAITGTTVNVTDGGTHAVTFTGFENFTISTGSGNDTLTTADGANVVDSGTGDDTITTGNGANLIDSGGGNDTVTAGQGANNIFGGGGNDTIVAGDGGNSIDGGTGDNGITSGAGDDILVAGNGNDTFISGAGEDLITVLGGVDTLDAGAADDRLIVNYSTVVTDVTGGVTGGTLAGGYDGAFADIAGTSSIVFQGAENFTVTTGSGNDNIATGDGTDVLTGGEGNDSLSAGGGNDMLSGGIGADFMDGGAGNDAFLVDNNGDIVWEGAGGGSDRVATSINYTLTAGSEIELFTTDNQTGTATISLTGNALGQTIQGNAGANFINGAGGADVMQGFGGNDMYHVDNAGDVVLETAGGGSERVLASVSYTLTAGAEIELFTTDNLGGTATIDLTGNGFAQTIQGNAGANFINGAGGADAMQGFGGNDMYYVDNAADTVFEADGGGSDRVLTSASYTLTAGSSVELFTTTNTAGMSSINLTGNAVAQTIQGNAGNNILNGGAGNDALAGFGGKDVFLFNTAPNASTNRDIITDFSHVDDSFQLDNAIFTKLGALPGAHMLDPAYFRAGSAALDANDYVVYNQATGALTYDSNGNGAGGAIQFATLLNKPVLTASDFVVV